MADTPQDEKLWYLYHDPYVTGTATLYHDPRQLDIFNKERSCDADRRTRDAAPAASTATNTERTRSTEQ